MLYFRILDNFFKKTAAFWISIVPDFYFEFPILAP